MDTPAALRLEGICKRFGGAPALRDAHLEVLPGEVLGLVGENGAGKSTLINIATGVLRPDAGRIELFGRPISVAGPRQAAGLGIAVVHQEADLFAQLTVAENMLLARGLVRNALGLIRWRATCREAERIVGSMGERFDVRALAGGLPVARRMMAEIAAAVSEQARVLFLDEPTSALTLKETESLFARIRALRTAGVAIIYVSHRLEEVLEICDRVTVLRDGETIETAPTPALTMEHLVSAMVGRTWSHGVSRQRTPIGAVRLAVASLCDAEGAFRDVSFQVRAGEIVGLYGFVGAGRTEVGQALFGLRRPKAGVVEIDGRPCKARSPQDALRRGLAYLAEDRLVQSVFRTHSVRSNASIAQLGRLCTLGWIRGRAERGLVSRIMADMRVRAVSMEQPIGTLSGGNQQKVVFGRWQATAPRVLVLDEPTRGVDVGAKAEIHNLIDALAAGGTAVVLISSELPEIMAMSDRVVTLAEGRQTGLFDPRSDPKEAIAAAAVPRADADANAGASAMGAARPSRWRGVFRFREAGLVGFIAALCALMAVLKPAEFVSGKNILSVLANAALPGIMAQGAMIIICAGGIDISVGSMMGLVGAAGALAAHAGYPPIVCLLWAVALGVAASLLNAGTSLLARIHPIIVTLAGISVYRGLMRIVTGGREVMNLPPSYRALADGDLFGVPRICYYVAAATLATHILLRYTLTGRRILALGNSESAARLIGLSKARLLLFAFAWSGALIGLTAVLHAGYYDKVQANTGEGWELKAIAAAVIGGTNILGGRGSALGALLGAILVALLYNLLILLSISAYYHNLFIGALILAAVLVDVGMQRWRGAVS